MTRLQTMMTALVFAIGCLGGLALAHSTGHESRTVAECEKLPTPERGHCIECVQRKRPHHFHPDLPPGDRCRPDDGKPQ